MNNRRTDRTETILIVDDVPANLRLLSQMLFESGYGVRAVTSGARALTSIDASLPDLILLDIRMPEMDGYQVCEHLKVNPKTHNIPIIFISALDATEDKVKAFTAGGVDYITKPFQVEEVLARIKTHLSLRKMQRQLQETNEKMERELVLAGEMQASFLPSAPTDLPGWQIAVTLKPARKMSGDFYDLNLLSNGQCRLLIADVVDKGVGAALYMVLSWSLLRTSAEEYPDRPEQVLHAANRRLLKDTHAEEFVTVFYGLLDPTTGLLTYANAGHSPAMLIRGQIDRQVEHLARTGVPLGVFEHESWEQQNVQIDPGDVLVLYTDGAHEAENERGEPFGTARLQKAVRSYLDSSAGQRPSAQAMQAHILAEIDAFTEGAPPLDDITLVIAVRD